jgi:hypothetical protein
VRGYSVAFAWGAGLILLAGLATLLVKVRKEDIPAGETVRMGCPPARPTAADPPGSAAVAFWAGTATLTTHRCPAIS